MLNEQDTYNALRRISFEEVLSILYQYKGIKGILPNKYWMNIYHYGTTRGWLHKEMEFELKENKIEFWTIIEFVLHLKNKVVGLGYSSELY